MKPVHLAVGGLIGTFAGLVVTAQLYWSAHAGQKISAPSVSLATAPRSSMRRRPWQDRFPNVELQTHEGKTVHFYDDLIKDKLVAINFMYASCEKL